MMDNDAFPSEQAPDRISSESKAGQAKTESIRSIAELVDSNIVNANEAVELEAIAAKFSVGISGQVVQLIAKTGINGPIARQFTPSQEERRVHPNEMQDPIGDEVHSPLPGIVHRHPDRVLLKPVPVCAVYCRFCFRRESVGRNGDVLTDLQLKDALEYIRKHPEIWEVILSGGDPLSLSDQKLDHLIRELNSISHVQVIRIHTRYPIVQTTRVTKELISILQMSRVAVYVALHCNHVSELTEDVTQICRLLSNAGIQLLSQTVLLSGVNDSIEALEQLFRGLLARRIRPYYLHHLDLAKGTNHFRVSIQRGQELMKLLRQRMSGLCQPTYVMEIPGGWGKIPIEPGYIERIDDHTYQLNYGGRLHKYLEST